MITIAACTNPRPPLMRHCAGICICASSSSRHMHMHAPRLLYTLSTHRPLADLSELTLQHGSMAKCNLYIGPQTENRLKKLISIWRALHEYVNFVHGPQKAYRSLSTAYRPHLWPVWRDGNTVGPPKQAQPKALRVHNTFVITAF